MLSYLHSLKGEALNFFERHRRRQLRRFCEVFGLSEISVLVNWQAKRTKHFVSREKAFFAQCRRRSRFREHLRSDALTMGDPTSRQSFVAHQNVHVRSTECESNSEKAVQRSNLRVNTGAVRNQDLWSASCLGASVFPGSDVGLQNGRPIRVPFWRLRFERTDEWCRSRSHAFKCHRSEFSIAVLKKREARTSKASTSEDSI